MANPYSPYDPAEDEAAAFGGQIAGRYSEPAPAGLPFSAQQGSTLSPAAVSGGGASAISTSPVADQGPVAAPRGLPFIASAPSVAGLPLGGSVVDPFNRYVPPTGPVMPPQYADLSQMYQQALANSQDKALRFFDIASGRDPASRPLQLLGALDQMRRQAEQDQMTRETHLDNMLKNEQELWTWVGAQREQLTDDPQALAQFDGIWGPRLANRFSALAQGTSVGGMKITPEDAMRIVSTPGKAAEWAKNHADADPADLSEAVRIYQREKDPAKKAAMAEQYLSTARQRKLDAAAPKVGELLDGLVTTMTTENGGRTPLVSAVVTRAVDAVDSMEQAAPGSVRRRYGVSPDLAKDAVRNFGQTTAGKAFYEQRGIRTSKVIPSLKDLGVSDQVADAIASDPSFVKLGVPLTDFGTLPAETQNSLRSAAVAKIAADKAQDKRDAQQTAADIRREARGNQLVLDPAAYVDVEYLRQTGNVKGPDHELTNADIASGRWRKVDHKTRESLASADQAASQAQTMFDNAKGLISATTIYGALVQKVQLEAGALTGNNPDAKLLKGQTEAISQLARALGEKGVLTDQDIKRIQSLMPAFGDTVATLKAKQEYLMNLLETSKQTARAMMLGEDVEQYRKRLRVLGGEADRVIAGGNAPKRLEYVGADRR